MAKLTCEEFLAERLNEAEREGERLPQAQWVIHMALITSARELLSIHAQWPFLTETQPRMETESGPNGVTYRMIQSIMWQTREEYTKRFGPEAPTAPFIQKLLLAYRDHPDFDEKWLNGHS